MWRQHAVPVAAVSVPLPPEWLPIEAEALDDPDERARLERDYEGAEGMFDALDAQEGRARIVFLAVDGSTRGTGRFAANLAVLAVEPRVPEIGLGVATDFALQALDRTLDLESDVERRAVTLPIGKAERVSFDHRVGAEPGEEGTLVRLDAALVTTRTSSFLVMLNRDAAPGPDASGSTPGDAVSVERILGGLQPLP